MTDATTHPTLAAALLYLEHGWSPLPLAEGTKWPPPTGVTGWRGRYTSRADLARRDWHWNANIAVRMPPDVVGVDVDVYAGGADGLAELEAKYGALPPSVWTTSRDDGSGIALFRVPNGTVLATDPAQGIDMIQAHHRYAVCAPSIHPKTQQPYRWIDEQSEDEIDAPPVPDELPALPWGWIDGLRMDKHAGASAATPQAAQSFFDEHDTERLAPQRLGGIRTMLAKVEAGGRHDALVATMCMAMREAAAGCYTAEEAANEINEWWIDVMSSEPHRRESGEFGGAVLWAVAQATDDTERVAAIRAEVEGDELRLRPSQGAPGAARSDVDPETGEIRREAPTNLPDAFWQSRPVLEHIRQAAYCRARSADAVLLCVLARIAVTIPPQVKLPAIVGSAASLNFLVATVGTSGAGKTTAADVAVELVPIDRKDVVVDVPLGSGEGLTEMFFENVKEEQPDGKMKPVKRQTKSGAAFVLDEGQAFAEMGSRKGSTLLPTMRSAWSGATLGQANASAETHRVLKRHTYRLTFIVGFQVDYAVGLLDDAAGGTPQRFVFAAANDPNVPGDPPEWPGEIRIAAPTYRMGEVLIDVDPAIAADVRARGVMSTRGVMAVDPLDSHRDLVRLKVATLLAYIDGGRLNVAVDDWTLAGDVMDASAAVRGWVVSTARQKAAQEIKASHQRHADREAMVVDTIETRALKAAARAVAGRVWRTDEPVSRRDLNHAVAGKHRKHTTVDEAIEEAVQLQWIAPNGELGYVQGKARPA